MTAIVFLTLAFSQTPPNAPPLAVPANAPALVVPVQAPKPEVTTFRVYLFTAETCAKCKVFEPTFSGWAKKYQKLAAFRKVDTTKDTEKLVEWYGITSLPSVVVTDGKMAYIFRYVPQEHEIAEKLGIVQTVVTPAPVMYFAPPAPLIQPVTVQPFCPTCQPVRR